MANSKDTVQLLLPTAVCQRKGIDLPGETRQPCFAQSFTLIIYGIIKLGAGIHGNKENVPVLLPCCLPMRFNVKGSDRRLCKKSIFNKLQQKHTESLQELIIPGQEEKSLTLTPRKWGLSQRHRILPEHLSLLLDDRHVA